MKFNYVEVNKFMTWAVIAFAVFMLVHFVNEGIRLNNYNKNIEYYSQQIEELKNKKAELVATQENVTSPEYIEKVAREQLDMYLPNETVYIDSSK